MKHLSRAKYAAIGFMLALALGCGMGPVTQVIPGLASKLHLGTSRGSHAGIGGRATSVAQFVPSSNYAYAQANTATVTDDFHGTCDFSPSAFNGIPPGFIIALPSDPTQIGASCVGVSDPQAPLHTSATDAGTASRLKADFVLDDGSKVRCQDKLTSTNIADNDLVGVYFRPDTNAVIAFGGPAGTTQLANTCTPAIPQGRTVRHIDVHLLKG